MALDPIGGRFMDESSGHETWEREDRERSPRSPTHHGDAPAAYVSASPESEHPKESVMETFARRWRNADHEYASDAVCTRVWEEHKLLGNLGSGRFARTYKVRQKSTGKVLALKLCSMRRLGGRAISISSETAAFDHKYEANSEHFVEEEIAENVRDLHLERTLLRCMTGLCPFVMEIATDCGFSCIFDDLDGELGYPMSADIGSLESIWISLDTSVKDKENEQVEKALQELLVFWAAQMADALRFLHQCNIIHCDVRTQNFVMGHDLYIRLIDFGNSFVDASQELLSSTLKPPRSLDGFNARRKNRYLRHVEFKFGFEHLYRKVCSAGYCEVEETQRKELLDKELVQLGKLYEVFNFGKTLFSLQWPCDIHFFYVFNDINLPKDMKKYRLDNPSPPTAIISSDLLDYVNRLIADHTKPGFAFENSNDLIRHRVFRDINFDELRAKQIRCSPYVYSLMEENLILNTDLPPLVTQPRSEEKEYCQKLSEKQKQVFRSNYMAWEREQKSSKKSSFEVRDGLFCVVLFVTKVAWPVLFNSHPLLRKT